MAKTISVTIAGRAYRMACGEGEERRLQELGRHVDQTLSRLRAEFGEIGDARLVIMTAVTLADDLFEAKRKIGDLEAQVAGHLALQSAEEDVRHSLEEEIAASLDATAERVERIARDLRESRGSRPQISTSQVGRSHVGA